MYCHSGLPRFHRQRGFIHRPDSAYLRCLSEYRTHKFYSDRKRQFQTCDNNLRHCLFTPFQLLNYKDLWKICKTLLSRKLVFLLLFIYKIFSQSCLRVSISAYAHDKVIYFPSQSSQYWSKYVELNVFAQLSQYLLKWVKLNIFAQYLLNVCKTKYFAQLS